MKVCIYLRKSRADEEMEKSLGQGETLSKHRKALLKFAKDKNYDISDIKEEIVSGESLFHRPKMLELLQEVENKIYDGILVMDMQRLGRGDMQDQGLILKTFKDSHTKIITPQKTYDLANEWDEEYSEFEAFMSRKELKMINRRMQGGRIRSVEDGNYIATNPPLGYDVHFIGKSRTLIPNSEAELVKMIFDMYVNQNIGAGMIAEKLNKLGFKSKSGNKFERTSIIFILKNYCYIGKITWKKKDIKKSKIEGKIKDTRTRDKSEWIIADGKHEAIIDESTFYEVQNIFKGRNKMPIPNNLKAANPLAGIIICGICGSKMRLRKYGDKDPHIICNEKCGNKSSKFKYIENAVIEGLKERLEESSIITSQTSKDIINPLKKQIITLNKEMEMLNSQKLKLYDLLEQGIYNNATFIERSKSIAEKLTTNIESIDLIENQILNLNSRESDEEVNKRIKTALDAYLLSNDIEFKNKILKSVVEKVIYLKSKKQRDDNFEINIYPSFLHK